MGAVNGLITADPAAALAVAGGLLAVGGGLTLRRILGEVGVDALTDDEAAEVDLLDAARPAHFWTRAVVGVRDSLRFAGGDARARWAIGPWVVDRPPILVGPAEGAPALDLATVRVETPARDPLSGRLIDDPATLARVLAVRAGTSPA
jgi:hypothetical protein